MLRSGGRAWRWVAAAVLIGVGLPLWWAWPRLSAGPLAKGHAAYARGDWAAAADLARARLRVAEADPEALRLLARATTRLGRDRTALAIYSRMGRRAMTAEDLLLFGDAQSRSGKLDAAIETWRAALDVAPDHPEVLERLARALAYEGRLDEAAQVAARLARQPGWEVRGDFQLGVLRADLDDPVGTAAKLLQALKRDPTAAGAGAPAERFRKLLAHALLQLGRPAEAREQLRRVLATGPDQEASWLLSRAELQAGRIGPATEALEQAGSYRGEHPLAFEPSPYVGEARCAGCHPTLCAAGMKSRHTRTFYRRGQIEDLPLPDHPLPDPDDPNVTHTVRRLGDQVQVETRIADRAYRLLVEYAFGTADRYVTMVGRDSEGDYRALRLSYYRSPEGTGWDRTAGDHGHSRRAEDFRGQKVDVREGVVRCLACHVTNARTIGEPSAPESADRSIGCERCHGPGGNHLRAVAAKLRDLAIVNPAHATAEATVNFCNKCHILGEIDKATDRTDPKWVRSQGAALTWSRCYTESAGALGCMTCHDPHRAAAEVPTAAYESRCLSCHSSRADKSPARSSPAVDAAPCPVDATKGCIGCHMPAVKDALPHTSLTDHYIRVHRRASPER
jgi:tetratricopeptide (TPR) repeat protein